ncbi:hypothetical protein Hanom_Chr12g01078601 [Helianthus anomalus]
MSIMFADGELINACFLIELISIESTYYLFVYTHSKLEISYVSLEYSHPS